MNTELLVQNPVMLAVCGDEAGCLQVSVVCEGAHCNNCMTPVQAHCSGYRISVDLRCAHCRLYFARYVRLAEVVVAINLYENWTLQYL